MMNREMAKKVGMKKSNSWSDGRRGPGPLMARLNEALPTRPSLTFLLSASKSIAYGPPNLAI